MTDQQKELLIDNANEVLTRINKVRTNIIDREGVFFETVLSYRIISAQVFTEILKVEAVEFTDAELFELFKEINRKLYH